MSRPKLPVRRDWVDLAICSLEYRLKIIGRLPFFKHLPAETIPRINEFFHDYEVLTGQAIYFEDDKAGHKWVTLQDKHELEEVVRRGAVN